MAIDAKDIQLFVWKIVKFSMNCCYIFVQKHPFVSGVVSLFFLLYLFLPSVFFFLIYSSPLIFCIYVYMRYYFKPKRPGTQNDRRVDDKSSAESKSLTADDAVVVSRNDNKPVINDEQISKRKNVNRDFDLEGSNKEKEITLAATPVDYSIVGSQNVITEEKGSFSLDQPDKVIESQPSMDDLVTQKDLDVTQKDLDEQSEKCNAAAGGGEEEEESSDEEEIQKDGKNAVEWTEDDQQNLMDLGDSDLERNKRLESLIARRRARKLFKMAVEKRVMESGCSGGQMPPISVVRENILSILDNQDYAEGLQVPGSAPSLLLPARNPFDIPYDPNEERPNLTGDSFQEEFTTHQRELFFCRHESFFLGPSFSLESQQDQHDSHFGGYGIGKRTVPGLRLSGYRAVTDMSAHDQLIDDLLASQGGEAMSRNLSATDLVELGIQSPKESKNFEESKHGMAGMEGEAIENSADRSEFQMDTDFTRDNSSEPCSFASDEASELSSHSNTYSNIGNLVPKEVKHRQHLSDRIKSSPTFAIPEDMAFNGPSYDSCLSAFEKPRMDDNLFFRDKGPCHSPGYSIASDLQVEVSELGSPPLPIDGTMSPVDAESSYDGDIEKDVTSGREEMWGASSHLAGVDENETRSREVNEVSMDDILGAGISAMKQNLQNQIASSSHPAQVAEQDKSDTSSLSSSRTGLQEDHTHSKHPDNKVLKNVLQVLEEVPKSSNSSHSLPPQIPRKASSAMVLVSHQPTEVSSKKPKELSNPPAEESAQVNATPEVDDQVVNASNEKDNLKSAEMMGGGSKISTNKEVKMDLSQPAENITSASSNDIEQKCDKPAKQQTETEPEGEYPKLNEPEEVGISSVTTGVQDEKNVTESGISGVNQSFDNPIMSPPLPQILEPDQISTISSSCSSPRSVLPGKNRRLSSASFDQQTPIQNDEPQSNLDGIVRNNSLDNMSAESVFGSNSLDDMSTESVVRNNSLDDLSTERVIIVSAPDNSQHLIADPIDLTSSSSSFRISEELSAEVVEGTSEPVINLQAAVVLSESVIGSPSKSEENAADSNASGNLMKEEETSNSPVQTTTEANTAPEPSEPAAETAVDKEPTTEAGVMQTVADDTSNVKSLIDQENVSDKLKTIEDYKQEPDDAKVVVEQPSEIEFEVDEAPKNEANTAE